MNALKQLDETLDLYLKQKAPAIPQDIKDLIVSFAPWINILLMLLAVPALIGILGLSTRVNRWAYWSGTGMGMTYYISMALLGLTLLLRGMAIPGLLSRNIKGWQFVYYSIYVDAVHSLLSYNIVGAIIGALIGLYVLFQIKDAYK